VWCSAAADPQDPAERAELVKGLHKLKTDIFMEIVESGAMPLRPGVERLVKEAMAAGEDPLLQPTHQHQAMCLDSDGRPCQELNSCKPH